MKHVLIAIILICIFFAWGIYFPKEPGAGSTRSFLVKNGESIKEIGRNLKKDGLINSQYIFDFYVLATRKSLKAGEYDLSPSMSVSGIAEKMDLGEVVKKNITIIEGWTVEDIQKYFKEQGIDGIVSKDLEGYLFPDTYEVGPDAKAEDAVAMMQNNFNAKLDSDLKNEIALQEKTISDIVKMASLLEKEVKTYEDKQIVSGILWKRMGIGMPLQVDAAKETYNFKGLPSHPICSPGLDSIRAAIYPVKTGYWFYLSAKDGRTIFSKNLAEHNRAIELYLR